MKGVVCRCSGLEEKALKMRMVKGEGVTVGSWVEVAQAAGRTPCLSPGGTGAAGPILCRRSQEGWSLPGDWSPPGRKAPSISERFSHEQEIPSWSKLRRTTKSNIYLLKALKQVCRCVFLSANARSVFLLICISPPHPY